MPQSPNDAGDDPEHAEDHCHQADDPAAGARDERDEKPDCPQHNCKNGQQQPQQAGMNEEAGDGGNDRQQRHRALLWGVGIDHGISPSRVAPKESIEPQVARKAAKWPQEQWQQNQFPPLQPNSTDILVSPAIWAAHG